MKRHLFMAAASLMLIALAWACGTKSDIGLQLYSIRGEVSKDLEGSLKSVSEIGYSFVEAAGYNGEKGTFYEMKPADFKALCNKYSLDFTSSHINGPDPNTVSWEECLKWWDKPIASHIEAGVPYIVQPSMSENAYKSLEGLKRYCELFNTVGEKCRKSGIRFGYHNHKKEFMTKFPVSDGCCADSVILYDYMLKNSDPENLFFQIDLYWIKEGGASSIEYFENYPGRFLSWHVKDEKEIGASGEIDFKAIYSFKNISGMKYQVVEQEAFSDGFTPFESIEASYNYLNNLKL